MKAAWSADVALAGLLPGRAVIVVNGGNPRTIAVGSKTPDGIKLLAVENGAATFEIDGKRQRLVLGEQLVSSGGSGGGAATVTLTADVRGHFATNGSVNGSPVRFLVDTGASLVSMSVADAARAGIDYRKGEMGAVSTANGIIRAWRVPGVTVQVGSITLHEVDVGVTEGSMPGALLGMSFLNRLEMKRDGDTMTLKKRY
jgi:aspartyl protease family protein